MRATANYNTEEQGTQQAKKGGNTHVLHCAPRVVLLNFIHLHYRHTRDKPDDPGWVDERRGRRSSRPSWPESTKGLLQGPRSGEPPDLALTIVISSISHV